MRKDSIIVASGYLTQDRQMNHESRVTVDKGIALLRAGEADFILMNGGPGKFTDGTYVPRGSHPVHCEVMRDHALKQGVPPELILMQDFSSDTAGEAYFAKEMHLVPSGRFNNIVVTRRYHAARAMTVYVHVLGPRFSTDFVSVETDKDCDPETLQVELESLGRFLVRTKGIAPGDSREIERMLYDAYGTYREIPKEQRVRFYPR